MKVRAFRGHFRYSGKHSARDLVTRIIQPRQCYKSLKMWSFMYAGHRAAYFEARSAREFLG